MLLYPLYYLACIILLSHTDKSYTQVKYLPVESFVYFKAKVQNSNNGHLFGFLCSYIIWCKNPRNVHHLNNNHPEMYIKSPEYLWHELAFLLQQVNNDSDVLCKIHVISN